MNGNIEDEYKKESSDNEIIESKSCKLKIWMKRKKTNEENVILEIYKYWNCHI
jgi:hypothetical protein